MEIATPSAVVDLVVSAGPADAIVSGTWTHFKRGREVMASPCLLVRRQQEVFLLQQRILQESFDAWSTARA